MAEGDDSVDTTGDEAAELRAHVRDVEALAATVPPPHVVPPAKLRAARLAGTATLPPPVFLPQAVDRTIEDPAGAGTPVRVRVLVPDTVRGAYLHIHGGGWVLGAANLQDPALWALANEAEVAVVSVDYRLAPEHPYPAGPDDCQVAARWLVEHAGAEFGTDRLLIGGASAGAHLALATLLRLRDRDGIRGAFLGADLLYGVYDCTMTPSLHTWGDRQLVLSTPTMAWFFDCFLPGHDAEARRDPDVSPLYADLADLPPALLTVGTLDPLLDDSLFLAARWRRAGGDADLRVYEGAPHGFDGLGLAVSKRANAARYEFVRRVLSPAPA